jgi:hypothetical protein
MEVRDNFYASAALPTGGDPHCTSSLRGFVDSRVDLDALGNGKISYSCRESNGASSILHSRT